MAVNTVTITISPDAANVAPVRCLAAQVPAIFGLTVDENHLALLTTELVTNAVRVDAGAVTVSFLHADGGGIRVEVHDHGGGWPTLTHPRPLDEDGGRGLFIVDALADGWGARSSPDGGTTVWFVLPAHPASTRVPNPAGTRVGQASRSLSMTTA